MNLFRNPEGRFRPLLRLLPIFAMTLLPAVASAQGAPLTGGEPQPAGAQAAPLVILTESFDTGTAPAGWTVDNAGGAVGWQFDNPGQRENNTGGGGGAAIADSDQAGEVPMASSLLSPELNLGGYNKVTLDFKSDFRYSGGETAAVEVLGASATWTAVWSRTAEERGPKSVQLDLTGYAGTTTRLRFRYFGANYSWWWQVDDVQVTAESAAPPPSTPTAPGNLQATTASASQINLAWSDLSTDETGFEIERSPTGADGWARIATSAANATSYSDTGLTCNTEVYYRVRAVNNGVFSAYTATARATTDACGGNAGTVRVEAVQVLGQQSGRYVAGKDTGVLVYLDNPVAVDAALQRVVVKRNSTTVATLTPQPSAGQTKVLRFVCPSLQACGGWEAGTYSFEATINGATGAQNGITFLERRPLRILAVPVKIKIDGVVKAPTSDVWKQAGSIIKDLYPISRAGFQWEIGQELDLSGKPIDAAVQADGCKVWKEIADLQPTVCKSGSDGPNCYDKIIGYLAEPAGGLNGWTCGSPANLVAIQSGMVRTTAHEVGHNFELGDEYDASGAQYNCDVNPTPPSYNKGHNWKDYAQAPFGCSNPAILPFTGATGGTSTKIIVDDARPFNANTGELLTGEYGNFMGNFSEISQAWISPHSWTQIFDKLAPAPPQVMAAGAPQRVVLAEGIITLDGQLFLDAWHTYSTTADTPNAASPYRIDAVDGSSQILASRSFELNYNLPDQDPLTEAPFAVEVPFPDGVTAFKVMSGTAELGQVPVSAGVPSVAITAPAGGETIGGEFTIRWNASDSDGDTLYFDVEYNENGDTADWSVLAAGITAQEWTDDFSTLPGGSQARVRVVASDGVNVGVATSEPFAVTVQAPETFIYEPSDDQTYDSGDPVFLDGDVWDAQDGWIADENAWVWTSNVDGELGRGPYLLLDGLSAGTHTITLAVTNKAGLSGTSSVTITVGQPGNGQTDLFLPLVAR